MIHKECGKRAEDLRGTSPVSPQQLAENRTTDELANLDFLRAVAVGLVFFDHLFVTMGARGMGAFGTFGVLLFFVHTALVLMMSMERLGLPGLALYKTFMVRRIFRIYPLSILSVLIVVCFRIPSISWFGEYQWTGWTAFASNLLLTQNLTHSGSLISVLWSLPFEIQMYTILPLLFLLALRFPGLSPIASAWLMAVGIAVAEYLARPGISGPDLLVARYFPCFLAGVFAWRLRKIRSPRFSGAAWVLFLIGLIVVYRVVDLLRVYGPGTLGALQGTLRNHPGIWWPVFLDLVRDWLFCAAVGLAVPHFLEIRSRLLKRISKWIARYSYGIYVSHVPIMWVCLVRLRFGAMTVRAALAVLLTAAVSVAAYHCLEEPAIRLGKRLTARLVQRPGLRLRSAKDAIPTKPTDSAQDRLSQA